MWVFDVAVPADMHLESFRDDWGRIGDCDADSPWRRGCSDAAGGCDDAGSTSGSTSDGCSDAADDSDSAAACSAGDSDAACGSP